jgi:hypothetical protein
VHGVATCNGTKQIDNAVLLTPAPNFIGWINCVPQVPVAVRKWMQVQAFLFLWTLNLRISATMKHVNLTCFSLYKLHFHNNDRLSFIRSLLCWRQRIVHAACEKVGRSRYPHPHASPTFPVCLHASLLYRISCALDANVLSINIYVTCV